MDGPYRDLGSGFARLSGAEAPRRAPSSISSVEDALLELLRNSRDAGASNIFVASTLRSRRFRSISVIDDGCGVPGSHADLIFEPGVTTRHLDPRADSSRSAHGAGLALHHIKNTAVEAALAHPSEPTAMKAVFDTHSIPERSLQSETRPSKSNLLATARTFASDHPSLAVFFAPPAPILASLLRNHIIQAASRGDLSGISASLGLDVSVKTVGRVLRGEVAPAERIGAGSEAVRGEAHRGSHETSGGIPGGPTFRMPDGAMGEVRDILARAAAASYLEAFDIKFESRPGEITISARIQEPEDEYD